LQRALNTAISVLLVTLKYLAIQLLPAEHTAHFWLQHLFSMACGLAADRDTASVHQADNRLPMMRLRSLWYPYPSLHILSLASACK